MPTEQTPVEAEAVEPKQPTLKKILDDKDQSAKFNVWLESQDKGELIAKVVGGNLEKADLVTLAEQRETFLKRQEQTREMREVMLNPTTLEAFTKASPELKQISDLIGDDGLREMLVSVVEDYSINRDEETNDPSNPKKRGDIQRHVDIFEIFSDWKKSEVVLKEKEAEQKEYLKNFMLTREEAAEVSQLTDVKERAKQIALRMVEKGLTPEGEERAWVFWKKPVWSKEQKELLRQASLELSNQLDSYGDKTKWTQTNEELENLRSVQKTAVTGIVGGLECAATNDGRKEIGRILNSEKKPKESMLSFGELKQEIERVKTPQAIENDFFDYADREFADYVTDNKIALTSPDLKNSVRDNFFQRFRDQLPEAAKGKGGIWKALYDTFVLPVIDPFLDECFAELKTKNKVSIDGNKKTLTRTKKK